MQKRYSEEFKESVIKKILPPNSVPVLQLSDVTIYKWRKKYRNQGVAVASDQKRADNWIAEDKLAAVIETASFNELQMSEYCRRKGLYRQQIEQWKESALSGYHQREQFKKESLRNRHEDKKKIKCLESELRRKEKALAETAALLVLSKKCEAIWGVKEED
jgi:transposase